MTPLATLVSVPLAFLFGFAAQRGRLCAVSAIRAWIEDETLGPFLSLFRCSAWVLVISLPGWWLWPAARVGEIYAFSSAGLVGAIVFGAGAAINGGCNFGTLTRFATGDASFAMTIVGAVLGVWAEGKLFGTASAGPIGSTVLGHPGIATVVLLAATGLWCIQGMLARGSEAMSRLWPRLAPMVMGLTGGTLYLINGGWAYTLDVSRLAIAPPPGEISKSVLLS